MFKKILKLITGSNLRNRFVLFFIISATVPLLVLGGITLYSIDLSHRHDVSNLELQLIDQKIKEIDKFLSDTSGTLELSLAAIQEQESETEEQEVYSPEKALEETYQLLENMRLSNPAFIELSFIDRQGQEIARSPRPEIEDPLQNVSNLERFKSALGGKNFISNVHYTLSGPMVVMASPVKNLRGDIVRVLSAEVNLSEIVKSIEGSRLSASGYLILLDQDGRLIASGSESKLERGIDLSASSRVKRILKGEVLNALDQRDYYEGLFDAEPVVGAGKKTAKTAWVIMVEWPLTEADVLIGAVKNQVLLLTLFSILAVIFISPILANTLIRPIRKLEIGAADIEKGNFEKRVDIKTNDELEDLGKAFNKMAVGLKRLDELREEFVFVAAHELRAPVTVIKGYVSMLLEGDAGPLKAKMKEFMNQIQSANKRLLHLVGDLLEVARSEAGRLSIEVAPVQIEVPVTATINELKQLAADKSISIEYKKQDLPKVLADTQRVQEVMVNLVGNAIKYTANGGHIWIYHEISDREVITHVKDDGFGISEQAQKKMFEKFYRVKTEKTRDITGTGLGLFIVKTIIEKMRGRVWFESKEGKGSTFSFSLAINK